MSYFGTTRVIHTTHGDILWPEGSELFEVTVEGATLSWNAYALAPTSGVAIYNVVLSGALEEALGDAIPVDVKSRLATEGQLSVTQPLVYINNDGLWVTHLRKAV